MKIGPTDLTLPRTWEDERLAADLGPGGTVKTAGAVAVGLLPVSLRLRLAYDGDRIQLQRLCAEPDGGLSLTPPVMARLRVAEQVHMAGLRAVEPTDLVLELRGSRVGRGLDEAEQRMVAAAYWLEYAIWGQPRQLVMAVWGVSRSTANRWIRTVRQTYPMPGAHDDGEA